MTSKTHTEAKVGAQATYCIGSDRYPLTVVAVHRGGLEIEAQYDEAKAAEGHNYFGDQKWHISRDETGHTERFTWKRSLGCYAPKGDGSGRLHLGRWEFYQDPSF